MCWYAKDSSLQLLVKELIEEMMPRLGLFVICAMVSTQFRCLIIEDGHTVVDHRLS